MKNKHEIGYMLTPEVADKINALMQGYEIMACPMHGPGESGRPNLVVAVNTTNPRVHSVQVICFDCGEAVLAADYDASSVGPMGPSSTSIS